MIPRTPHLLSGILNLRCKTPEVFQFRKVTIDFRNHNVLVNAEGKYLTRIEWLLLSQLESKLESGPKLIRTIPKTDYIIDHPPA
jgi:hypothetical protein